MALQMLGYHAESGCSRELQQGYNPKYSERRCSCCQYRSEVLKILLCKLLLADNAGMKAVGGRSMTSHEIKDDEDAF